MMRIGLFLLTNLAVLLALFCHSSVSVVTMARVARQPFSHLFCVWYGGLVSLMSKWMAKKTTGTELIDPLVTKLKAGYCKQSLNFLKY